MIINLRKNKLGMTLIEMIISLVILSILMTSTMGMIMSSNSLFVSTSQAALDKRVCNGVFDLMESVLKYSTHLMIYDSNSKEASEDTGYQTLTLTKTDADTNSGTINYKRAEDDDAVNLYDQSFYNKRTVQYSVKKVGKSNKHLKLTVTTFRDGKAVYSRDAVIKCVNLNLVAVGTGANPLVDKSGDDAVNQYIRFAVDEMLISGGKNAFSLEYKVSEYMARYNRIQNEYVGKLGSVYGRYGSAFDRTDDDGNDIGGVTNTEDKEGSRLLRSLFMERTNKLTKIVFGDGTTVHNDTDVDKCINLRAYYQEQIKDLLKFTPTAAGYKEGEFKKVTEGKVGTDGGRIEYTTHTGDAFYGVVATREELFTGFMLTYYDKNNDGKISKSEYPQFDENFFSGTSIGNYISNTSANQMVIMTYFKENTDGDYDSLINYTSGVVVNLYDGQKGYDYHDKWVTGSQPGKSFSSETSQDTITSQLDSSEKLNGVKMRHAYSFYSYDENKGLFDKKYTKYEFGITDPNNLPATLGSVTSSDTKTREWAQSSYNQFKSLCEQGGSPLIELNSNNCEILIDGQYSGAGTGYILRPKNDLKEGWYSFVEGDVNGDKYAYHVFYLEAAEKSDGTTNEIAVVGDEIRSKVDPDKTNRAGAIELVSHNWSISRSGTGRYRYKQAVYELIDSGATDTVSVTTANVRAHQYTDYVIYGVDWNSWFNATPSGLLNKVLTGTVRFWDTIFGKPVNKTVKTISAENAVQSLGNKGQFTTNNFDGEISSYNLAWVVYSSKRGTYYYLPSGSTRLSNATSSISWSSNKDQPIPIDVELGNGKTWANSTAMMYDIESRKMTSSGLFGLVDTTKDTLWVALPTGTSFDTSTLTTEAS